MEKLLPLAEKIAASLIARGETVGVAESSTGGLISTALLSVPGASAYYRGGGVIYTPRARAALVNITKEEMEGMRSASEPYAALLAFCARALLNTTWGLERNRCDRPNRKSLRRRCGTLLHGCRRPCCANNHVRNRQQRSRRPICARLRFSALELFDEIISAQH